MVTHESAEMYLETILILSKKGDVRSIDIANELEYSKPSISVAMKRLRESGCIVNDPNGFIKLTDEGRRIAETIYERHTLIADLLMALGVSEETALQDACKMEHVISTESFDAIKKYAESRRAEKR